MIVADIGFRLDEIPDIGRYLSLPSDVAFVSGSQQVGLGNSTSDYDLYIVYGEGLERLKEGPKQFWLKDPHRRIDLERHAWDEIAAAATTVNGLEPVPAVAGKVPFDVFDIYYRTAVGAAVANDAAFAELTAALDTARFDAAFAAWSLWQTGVELARARQRLSKGRPEAACVSARLGLRHTVTASMSRAGYGWPNPKWAFVKLACHFGRASDEYRRAWALNGLGRREPAEYVAEVAEFCAEHGAPWLVPASAQRTVFGWRGEGLQTSIAGRTYLVHAKRDVYELDEPAAYLCALVDGRTALDEIVDSFAARFDLALPVAAHRAEELFDNLCRGGLLRSHEEYVLPQEVS